MASSPRSPTSRSISSSQTSNARESSQQNNKPSIIANTFTTKSKIADVTNNDNHLSEIWVSQSNNFTEIKLHLNFRPKKGYLSFNIKPNAPLNDIMIFLKAHGINKIPTEIENFFTNKS